MTDEYALTVNLKVMPEHKSSYAASLQQAGPKGALQERAATHFRTGQKLQVRVNPESSSYVVLDKEPGWGPWIVASVIGFFFMAIGLTILNEPLSDK
ncbi:MAG: DUF3592 domain-containing protein, partial [Gammaproteobacteria bacterium]|nr:DUF3592 domain-containing protein [Gammaproteobacteria bacterium]